MRRIRTRTAWLGAALLAAALPAGVAAAPAAQAATLIDAVTVNGTDTGSDPAPTAFYINNTVCAMN
jgi:uncharacterized low-complexity protein